MIKHFLFAIALLSTLYADAQITRQWVATHNGQGDYNDRFTCVVRDQAGNYYLGGSTVNPGTDRDFLVLKTDAAGNTLWSLQLDGNGQAADEVVGLALGLAGEVVATGISKGDNTSEDFWTIKMSAAGDTMWSRRYDYIGEYDQPNALALDAAGNIFVTGLSDGNAGAGTNDDYLTVKYDPNGTLLWANRFNGLGDATDRAVGVAANATGQVFVTGYSDNGQNDDYVTISYDATGAQQWIKYDDRGDRDRAAALTLDPAGNLLIAGQSSNGDNDDFWVLKYTPTGTPLWQKAYDFVDDDRAIGLATDAAGNVFVTGQSDQDFSPARNWNLATVSFSPNGVPRWVARYDGPLAQDEFATAIATDAAGNVFVTGRGDSDPGIAIDNELITISYQNSNGNERWKTTYTGLPNRDNASRALRPDENGGCLVVGYAEDSTAFRNALSVHYSDTGATLWEKQFQGLGDNNESVRMLAVSDSGNAYAAGFTVSNGDNRNLTLVRFHDDGTYDCRYVENGSAASAIDDAQGLLLDADGLPIIMGYVKNDGSSNDIFLAKFNAACDTLWQRDINGGANGSERAYDMSSDGDNVLLTGRSDQQAGPVSNDVAYTLKIRKSDGVTLWVRKYDADTAATRSERGVVVRAKDANHIYVAGRAFNGTDLDVFLLKYDGNGNRLWVRPWSADNANEAPVGMALDAAGNIYVLANTAPNTVDTLHNMVLLKYDPAGNLLWSVLYDSPANGNEEAVAIATDANDNVIVTGKVDLQPGSEVTYGIVLLKYAPNGDLLWLKNIAPPATIEAIPDAMTLHANGQIYLAGHVNAGTAAVPNVNVLVLVLDANGHELWSDTYDGTAPNGSDVPNTILLHGNDLYVGGSTVQPGQQRDMLVIKYSGLAVGTVVPVESTIRVFPNPATDILTFQGLPRRENVTLELCDATGRLLRRQVYTDLDTIAYTLSDLPEGLLLYRIFADNRLLGAGKVCHVHP